MLNSVVSTLSNTAYRLINNGITQNAGIEEIVVATYLALKGKDLFAAGRQGGSLSSKQWTLLAPAAKLSGLALLGGGLKTFYSGISQLSEDVDSLWSYMTGGYPKGEYYLNEEGYSCFKKTRYHTNCANSYERDVKERWGKEMLSFDASDPRKKVLILGPHEDPTTTSPTRQYNEDRFDFLNEKFDLRYKVIDNPLQACREIQKSVEEVSLHRIIFNVHGNSNVMQFGKPGKGSWKIFDPMVSNDCFKGLPRNAKIILSSCLTGDRSVSPNIAESIAWLSEREVIAPTESMSLHGVFYSEGENGELSVDFKNVDGMVYQSNLFSDAPKENYTDLIESDMCHSDKRVPGRNIANRIVPQNSTESLGERILPHLNARKIKRGAINSWGLSKGAATLMEVAGKGLNALAVKTSREPIRFALSASASCAEKIGAAFNRILDLPFTLLSWTYAKMKARN